MGSCRPEGVCCISSPKSNPMEVGTSHSEVACRRGGGFATNIDCIVGHPIGDIKDSPSCHCTVLRLWKVRLWKERVRESCKRRRDGAIRREPPRTGLWRKLSAGLAPSLLAFVNRDSTTREVTKRCFPKQKSPGRLHYCFSANLMWAKKSKR